MDTTNLMSNMKLTIISTLLLLQFSDEAPLFDFLFGNSDAESRDFVPQVPVPRQKVSYYYTSKSSKPRESSESTTTTRITTPRTYFKPTSSIPYRSLKPRNKFRTFSDQNALQDVLKLQVQKLQAKTNNLQLQIQNLQTATRAHSRTRTTTINSTIRRYFSNLNSRLHKSTTTPTPNNIVFEANEDRDFRACSYVCRFLKSRNKIQTTTRTRERTTTSTTKLTTTSTSTITSTTKTTTTATSKPNNIVFESNEDIDLSACHPDRNPACIVDTVYSCTTLDYCEEKNGKCGRKTVCGTKHSSKLKSK